MSLTCTSCQKTKAPYVCGLCRASVCKTCVQFVETDEFSFYQKVPDVLSHGAYCLTCFDEKVSPEIARYHRLINEAKQVNVYTTTQTKETRLMKRTEKKLKAECWDKDEALLRLGFLAAQNGFDTLIDVDVVYEKMRDHAYQKTKWTSVGIPFRAVRQS